MSEFNTINPDIAEASKKLDEVINKDPEIKEVVDNIPKPDEEELMDIFTEDKKETDEEHTENTDDSEDGLDSDFDLNPDDMAGLEELQNLFKLFGAGTGANVLDMPQIVFQKLDKTIDLPKYAHPGDAGMDVCSSENVIIPSMQRKLVHTGLRARIPEGLEIQVRPRSGLALKHGITVLNTPGTIDSGYRGEIGVILANFGDKDFTIKKGDRIAQLVVASFTSVRVLEGDVDKDETDRGAGGFGSTGVSEELNKEEPVSKNGAEDKEASKEDPQKS